MTSGCVWFQNFVNYTNEFEVPVQIVSDTARSTLSASHAVSGCSCHLGLSLPSPSRSRTPKPCTARTTIYMSTSHVSRLTKGLALHMGNRTSLPPFGWIRRGNNYTSKIQDVHQCVTAWHAWNHGCCHRLPLQRRPLLCAAASSLSRCMQACLSLVASLTSR